MGVCMGLLCIFMSCVYIHDVWNMAVEAPPMQVCMFHMYGWMYECTYGCMGVCMDACMYIWMYVFFDRWPVSLYMRLHT
jgi:hypothetical protein